MAYQNGWDSTPTDWRTAVGYLERGCGGKIPEACASLILVYEGGGDGVAQDLAHADRLIANMCADGFTDYCTRTRAPVPGGQ